jgi:PKHD-type hydroxylase
MRLNPIEFQDVTYPFCFHDNTFTPAELEAVKAYCTDLKLESGVVIGAEGKGAIAENRKSDVKFIMPDSNNYWIFEKIKSTIEYLNERFYGFDLWGFDTMQYTVYNEEGSKYDFHMDTTLGTERSKDAPHTRKLSMTLLLSEPSEYEGGEFQIQTGLPENPLPVEQPLGRMIIFPSLLIHRVTPIIKGTRKSLVVWCVGPKFK